MPGTTASSPYLDIVAVGGALGAEIRGVDPRSLDDEGTAAVRAAILEHEVVFFRGVHLDEDEQVALAARFGQPSTFPLGRLMGASEPTLQVIADGPGNPSRADGWHTDVTWTVEPPDMAFLVSLVAPARGGDTMWASMTAVFDALSPTMQRLIAGLTVRHDNESFIGGLVDKAPDMALEHNLPERLRALYPPVEHPLVRTHPETGRQALFLGGRFMRSIVGMESAESEMLLDFLRSHMNDARFHVRWRWEPGDLAIWDERSTNHRAVGDSGEQERVIRRIEIDGTRPFYDPTP